MEKLSALSACLLKNDQLVTQKRCVAGVTSHPVPEFRWGKGKDQVKWETSAIRSSHSPPVVTVSCLRRAGNRWVCFGGIRGDFGPIEATGGLFLFFSQLFVKRPTRNPTSCFAAGMCVVLCYRVFLRWIFDFFGSNTYYLQILTPLHTRELYLFMFA